MSLAGVFLSLGIIIGCAGAVAAICLSMKKTVDSPHRSLLKRCIAVMVAGGVFSVALFVFLPFEYKFYMWVPYPFAFLYVIFSWKRRVEE